MRLNRKHNWVLLIFGIALLAAFVWNVKGTSENDIARSRERASNITRAYGEELQNDLDYGIQAAESLREMVWEKHGIVENFEPTARAMRRNSVGRLGLIRDGRMEYAYPEDISTDRFRSLAEQEGIQSSADHARKHRKAVLYGPMNFAGLGEGVVALKAIFVVGDSGKEEFWGYSVVLIKTPDVYVKTLNTMNSMGYDYYLDTTIRPDSGQMVQIESSVGESETLTDPVGYTFFKGQCKWRINIMPHGGWHVRKFSYVVIGSSALWFGLMILMYFLLHTLEADKRLERLVHQDVLTGVLNRQGFSIILFANRDAVSLFGCSDYVDLINFTGEHYVNLIHPEDQVSVQQQARKIVQDKFKAQVIQSRANNYPIDEFMRYRLVTRDGTEFPVIDISRLVHDEHYGEVFFTFLFRAGKKEFTAQADRKQE